MQAIVHHAYGPFDMLKLRDVEEPAAIGDHDVVVRVEAASVQVGDCFGVHGAPLPMRLVTGLLRPKTGIPGFDLAGRVAAVGKSVTRFRIGDEVFGTGDGSCAQLTRTDDQRLALKPSNLGMHEAAALPTSAVAALHGLRDAGRLQPGQRALINGASGGIGTFAVQIAKSLGAEVTGVCSTASLDLVRSLGADDVIDYRNQDFTRLGRTWDVILDNVENRALSDVRRALTPRGTLVLNSGTGARGLAMMIRLLRPLLLNPFVKQTLRRYLSTPKHDDLMLVKELAERGALRPVIDRTYALRDTPAALRHVESGHAHGKVVVTP